MTTKTSALNWFEIPVADFDRAKGFYETILQCKLQDAGDCANMKMAIFPYDNTKGVGGALTKMEGCTPGAGGTVVYLNVEGDLQGVLERIPTTGGAVIKPYTSIGEHGFIGIFKDCEGNVVGLHSFK